MPSTPLRPSRSPTTVTTCLVLTLAARAGRLGLDPAQIVATAVRDRRCRDLWHLVRVIRLDVSRERVELPFRRLHQAQPLLRRLDRALPPIGAAVRPDDLDAGSEASLNCTLRQSLRPTFRIDRRDHLQVTVLRHAVTSPRAPPTREWLPAWQVDRPGRTP